MKNQKILFSFLISVFWFFLFIFWEIIWGNFFINKYYFFMFTGNIFINLPFFFAIFFSSYVLLKTKNFWKSVFIGFFLQNILLFLFVVFWAEYFFYGIASVPSKNTAFLFSSFIFLKNSIFLFLNQKIIFKNFEKIKKIIFKISKIFFVYLIFYSAYFFFNSIIIFFATMTGASKICDFNLRNLPPPIQNGQKSFLYPETCLLEMAKKGFDICEKINDNRYKNSCFLETSLQKKDKKICEKISDSPAGFYMDCIFREKNNNFANKCMFPNYIIENYGKNISFKDCVKKKFLEFSKNKK